MKKIFYARLSDRFIEQPREQPQEKETSQNESRLIFFESSFSSGDNVRALIQLEGKKNPRILKDDFPSKPDLPIHISILPELSFG